MGMTKKGVCTVEYYFVRGVSNWQVSEASETLSGVTN